MAAPRAPSSPPPSTSVVISWVDPRLLDCLSVAWSHLPVRDFARVIRCCRAWLQLGGKHTAWPPTCVERIARCTIEEDAYDDGAARRITVNVNRTSARRGLQRACHSLVWSRCEDVHVYTRPPFYQQQQQLTVDQVKHHDDAALRALLRMPRLKILNLALTRPSCAAVHECFTRISTQLECLITNIPRTAVVANLHLLRSLRVLVIRIHRPEWASVHTIGNGPASQLAKALADLQQLVSLHYEDSDTPVCGWAAPVQLRADQQRADPVKEATEVLAAVRHLSRNHALRKLSIRWQHSIMTHPYVGLDLTPLGNDARLEQVQLEMLVPTEESLRALIALPALVRLHWLCSMDLLATVIKHAARPTTEASALRHLRLHNYRRDENALYTLLLPGVIAYWTTLAPALDELEVRGARMRASDWSLLPRWSQLTVLHIRAPLQLSADQVAILQGWRSWTTIHLHPARRGGPSCDCRWRLTRRLQRSWNNDDFYSPNSWSNLRLCQESPPNADEHGHVSSEYVLRSRPMQMTDEDTPSAACPEWVPVEDAPD